MNTLIQRGQIDRNTLHAALALRNPGLSEKNMAILVKRFLLWDANKGFRHGDFLLIDGKYHRMAHIWKDDVQPTDRGSWYWYGTNAEFSGGLDDPIPNEKIHLTTEIKYGLFWIFNEGIVKAHNGINITIPCRVYAVKGGA